MNDHSDTSGAQTIALHGVPRSGTTWLGEIFNSVPDVCYRYQPLFSYAFKSFLSEHSTREEIACFFGALRKTQDRFVLQVEERARGIVPDFPKGAPVHLVYKEVRYHHILSNLLARDDMLKAVLVVRDPRGVVASFLDAPREFRRDLGWQVEEEWRFAPKKNLDRPEEFFGFEKWKEATGIFLALAAQYPKRVRILRYSDLLRRPEEVVRDLFEFSALEFCAQTQAFLSGRISGNPQGAYTVFRSARASDDKWRQSLPDSIAAEICADLADGPLAQFLD